MSRRAVTLCPQQLRALTVTPEPALIPFSSSPSPAVPRLQIPTSAIWGTNEGIPELPAAHESTWSCQNTAGVAQGKE